MVDKQYEIHRADSSVNFMAGAYARISNLFFNIRKCCLKKVVSICENESILQSCTQINLNASETHRNELQV